MQTIYDKDDWSLLHDLRFKIFGINFQFSISNFQSMFQCLNDKLVIQLKLEIELVSCV